MMKQLLKSLQLFGSNAPFIEELYENYLENPDSVSPRVAVVFRFDAEPAWRGPDVAHYPIINAFCRDGQARPGSRTVVDPGANQKAGQRSPADQRPPFPRHPLGEARPAQAYRRPEIHELELSTTASPRLISTRPSTPAPSTACRAPSPPCARSSTPCARPTAVRSAPSTCT